MKNFTKLSIVLMACMLTTNLYADFFVAGNAEVDDTNHWCNGENWSVNNAKNALDANGTITFTNVPAGNRYEFKITDGQWDGEHEFTTVDFENSDDPMYGGDGNNICFSLSAEADVTISLVDNKVRLHATKPLTYLSNYYYIVGNGNGDSGSSDYRGAWCNGQNWGSNSNENKFIDDQISYKSLPAQWYEFRVIKGNWEKSWDYPQLNISASTPMYKTYGGNVNICFRLTEAADVTVKIVKNQVVLLVDREFCISGNGNDIAGNVWLSGHNWLTKDDDYKLDANYRRTFPNLPAGSYKFVVKDNVDAWSYGDDCTWGWGYLDSENSNVTCVNSEENHIQFTIDAAKDVTIALVNNKIRVTATNPAPTAVENVNFKNDGKYYDVLGRQIANPQKGNLYIHNGKKVLY